VFLPKHIPQGFELDRVRITWRKEGQPALHMVYSDGLAKISLFEGTSEKNSSSSAEGHIVHQGKTVLAAKSGHRNVLRIRQNDINVGLVSEIPRQELINMITSLERFESEEEGGGS
jgi:negative regulator of sigma E activity